MSKITLPENEKITSIEGASMSPAPQTAVVGMEGDYSATDLETPQLKLVQPNSDLVETLGSEAIGQFVYADHLTLGDSVNVIVLACRKKYVEELPNDDFNPESPPRIFDTLAEAEANGVDETKPLAFLDLIVEVAEGSPAASESAFVSDGKAYLLARFAARGRSYGIVRTLWTTANLKGDASTSARLYELSAVLKPVRGKKYRVATLTSGNEVAAELGAKIASVSA